MIAIVDYGRGNLFSIGQALRLLGARYEVTADPVKILAAERVILPGVGAFGDAMDALGTAGLIKPLMEVAERNTPLLGICLGMELLASRSEEFGQHEGLGLILGTARRLPKHDGAPGSVRIPNVGWRPLSVSRSDPILGGIARETMMYFVHSYALIIDNPDHVIATIRINGLAAAAVVRRGNVIGCQFHPERSATAGLEFLRRFLECVPLTGANLELSNA